MNTGIFAKGMVFAIVCAAAGCAPQSMAIRPGVTGMVVDAANGQPISGATVALEGPLKWAKGEYSSGKTTGRAQATSGADGKFSIDPLMSWGFRSAASGEAGSTMTSRVTVQKLGYLSQRVLFSTDKSSDIGSVSLKSRSGSTTNK